LLSSPRVRTGEFIVLCFSLLLPATVQRKMGEAVVIGWDGMGRCTLDFGVFKLI
jgi:hypothetical protein